MQFALCLYLWPSCQVDSPKLAEIGRLGRADELVGSATQEVAAGLIAQRPPTGTILGDADLETTASIPFLVLAEHVAERVHGQVLVQM